MLSRRELYSLVLVGGAAQLHVGRLLICSPHRYERPGSVSQEAMLPFELKGHAAIGWTLEGVFREARARQFITGGDLP